MDFAKRNIRALEKQNKNLEQLLKLHAENPDLPIIPAVDTEVVGDDCYGWWHGFFGAAHIEEMLARYDGSVICKSDDSYDGLYEELFGYDADFNENATDEEVKAKVDALPWLKCIVVNISTPEFEVPERRPKREHGDAD